MTYDLTRPVILGLGKTGLSMVRYLMRYDRHDITVMDSRANPPGKDALLSLAPHAHLVCGHWEAALLQNASVILASPGVDTRELSALSLQAPVIGDVELFALDAQAPIVAVTGTNGKSSVVSLLAHMAECAGVSVQLIGNIGTPVLDVLDLPVPDYYIMELSSFQLETTYHLNPYCAVVLNVAEDHMDRYDSLGDYRRAKQRIYHHARYPLINDDEPACWEGVVDPDTADHFSYQLHGHDPVVSGILLNTPHQKSNALAALAMGRRMGLSEIDMTSALQSFTGLAHRCQRVPSDDGVCWYNDSKATNVASALAAIQSLAAVHNGALIWIAGGQGKGQDFSPLASVLDACVDHAIVLGEDADTIAAMATPHTSVHHVDDLCEAVQLARDLSHAQDVVLFSPACASFDMFDNFEHRGAVFEQLVSGND